MSPSNLKDRNPSEIAKAWLKRLRAWRASGLTVRAFCEMSKLSEPSFYHWKRRLGMTRKKGDRDEPNGNGADGKQSVSFIPLGVSTTAPMFELRMGAHTVRVPMNFDAAALQRLLATLEAMPCG